MDERIELVKKELSGIINILSQNLSIASVKVQETKLRELYNKYFFPMFKEGIILPRTKDDYNDAISRIHNLAEFGFQHVDKKYIIRKLQEILVVLKRYRPEESKEYSKAA